MNTEKNRGDIYFATPFWVCATEKIPAINAGAKENTPRKAELSLTEKTKNRIGCPAAIYYFRQLQGIIFTTDPYHITKNTDL